MPADMIGRITVPLPVNSGLTWPLPATDFGYGEKRDWKIITHQFGSGATLQSQRFSTGSGLRRFQYVSKAISIANRSVLTDFFTAVQGSFQYFIYNVPSANRIDFTPVTVIFDVAPLTITDLATMCSTGIQFIEIVDPASAPSYAVSDTNTRFPSSFLATALLSDIQNVIPLVRIRVRNAAVPDIYFADRRVTVGGIYYIPRLLNLGEEGTDVIFSQDISGKADTFQFTLGNADRAISALVKDTSLRYADISFSLFHVDLGVKIDLWRGNIQDWQTDGSAQARVFCSDGLFQITQPYPRRTITRDCWKTFDDGVNCPFTSQHGPLFPGVDSTSCDYFFNSPNGCLAHGMSPFFGGHPTFPQSVIIKDDGTGVVFGFGRSTVTSTSVVSDNIPGQPLPEIWCSDDNNPQNAFIANAIIAAVRDESTFEDILGIVGVGPLGLYEGMSVQTNADGYTFIVAPLADGFPPQGFKVDGQLQITGYHPELGLREILGTDPANKNQDFFSLGQGTPQHWDVPDATFSNILTGQPNQILPFAAGTAFVELRYSKNPGSGIAPTTAESHSMTVPISQGLTWDQSTQPVHSSLV